MDGQFYPYESAATCLGQGCTREGCPKTSAAKGWKEAHAEYTAAGARTPCPPGGVDSTPLAAPTGADETEEGANCAFKNVTPLRRLDQRKIPASDLQSYQVRRALRAGAGASEGATFT